MPLFGLNTWMLLGLAGVAIPILIHLLNRRRFDVVDWGAMQFLHLSETTRRRVLIEEVLLMLLRMGLIALMVLALAAPTLISPWLSKVKSFAGGRPNRDVVIVFDGSYSMGYTGGDKTPHELAKEWALAYVNDLSAGDSVAILQAKQQVVRVIGEPTADLEKVRESIRKLPEPRGGCQWPQAMQAALEILSGSGRRPLREIIVLGDGQRFGWCDSTTLLRWELMAQNLTDDLTGPSVWVVNVSPEAIKKEPPNWTLTPIRASRAVASTGQEVRFRTGLQLSGQKAYKPPYRIRLEIDGGRERKTLPFPQTAELQAGQLPLEFSHRFPTAGSHLVTVIVEPDPPKDQRAGNYVVKDELPGDNRQDTSVEVVNALPVLMVDGDPRPTPKTRGTDFLRKALAPASDQTPAVLARVVSILEFTPDSLRDDLDRKRPGSRPRVLILSNVERLSPSQLQAVTTYLNEGGSVLVTLGERVDAAYYNEQLFRGGDGWLPARLEEKSGSETEEDKAVQVRLTSLQHPALETFRDAKLWDLTKARFPRWWKLGVPGKNSTAAAIALLTNDEPFLVERAFGQGRVILATVPLDRSWRTNFWDLASFPTLAHELVYYLAGARATDFNLAAGQPLRYRPGRDETPAPLSVQPPEGEAKTIPAENWPPVFEETRETGVYVLKTPDERTFYYVVQPDLQESDLTRSEAKERDQVAARFGSRLTMKYQDDRAKITGDDTTAPKLELWWLFMIGVTLLMLSEVWMTRKIALNR